MTSLHGAGGYSYLLHASCRVPLLDVKQALWRECLQPVAISSFHQHSLFHRQIGPSTLSCFVDKSHRNEPVFVSAMHFGTFHQHLFVLSATSTASRTGYHALCGTHTSAVHAARPMGICTSRFRSCCYITVCRFKGVYYLLCQQWSRRYCASAAMPKQSQYCRHVR